MIQALIFLYFFVHYNTQNDYFIKKIFLQSFVSVSIFQAYFSFMAIYGDTFCHLKIAYFDEMRAMIVRHSYNFLFR